MLNSTERGPGEAVPLPPRDHASPRELFLRHLPDVERAVACACRRRRFSREETEDFASVVRIKLMEDDFAVFRKFEGRAKLATYLTIVVQREMCDYLNHLWGKWRPSREAERLGDLAVLLERLTVRDGHEFDHACEVMRTSHHVAESPLELAKLWARLPRRTQRRLEGEEGLRNLPSPEPGGYQRLCDQEAEASRERTLATLQQVLAELPAEDRLIAMMYGDGFKKVAIAKTLGRDQKPFYRRMEKLFQKLREKLESAGLRREDIEEMLHGGQG